LDNISLHLKNIYKENELDENSTTEDFSVVQKPGIFVYHFHCFILGHIFEIVVYES
jgi:hypothetical protein